ncbi:MAG: RrF2 family transcriptional regulator [Thermoanaerobaculia bacterium]
MLTRRAKYGLKALLALARAGDGATLRIADIAEREQIPKKFLEGILLELRNRGLVASRLGAGGGYALARPADLISMGEAVRVLDGPLAPINCVSQTAYEPCDDCEDEAACALRLVMKEVRDGIAATLDHTTLRDAVERRKKKVY